MNRLNQLSWENFKATVFLPGQQRVHRVMDSPRVDIFGDGQHNRIGMWLEIPVEGHVPEELGRLSAITAHTFDRDNRHFLEIATANSALHRQFYHFAVAVAERVVVESRLPQDAVSLELRCFTELVEQKPILGIERQIGLIGELLLLERLVSFLGPSALDAWVGPDGEPHDFRIGMNEFEVKTTVSPHRIHVINGTEQLVPSKDCSLYLVSVLLGPAGKGGGFSLANTVTGLRDRLANDVSRLNQFAMRLEAYGYQDSDQDHYTREFSLRRALAVCVIDQYFPAITRTGLSAALGDMGGRIESLQYEVNVEGLEHEEASGVFRAVLPFLP